jgi:hypothetical protein
VLELAAVAAVALVASGCSFLYRTRRAGEHFVVYSDRSAEFVERTAERVGEIYRSYIALFGIDPRRLRSTTICLDGEDDDVVDHSYCPDLLGYYVPFLRLIRVDTRPAMTSERRGLDQVLLHEIAHHFVANEYPRATRECWLNEGLASNLEVTVIEDGRAEHPLLNAPLLEIVRRAALLSHDSGLLEDVIRCDWDEFHEQATRERNYAVAWSICYYLLTEHLPRSEPLGARIEALYRLDRRQVVQLESEWRNFIADLDPVATLAAMARSPDPERRLTARWAIRELGELRGLESPRALLALGDLVEGEDVERAALAAVALLDLLARSTYAAVFAAAEPARGLERVRALIGDRRLDVALRARILDSVGRAEAARERWIPVLVEALDHDEPVVRAAAAQALARLDTKPTIVNPAFWARAPADARAQEVSEWREWLAERSAKSP